MTAIYCALLRFLAWITGTATDAGLLRLEEIVFLVAAVLFSWLVLAAVCYLFGCAVKHGQQREFRK